MNRYVFVVNTNTIKCDNVFTLFDNTFQAAFDRIVKDALASYPIYINISLVYTDDKQAEDFINESNIDF